MMKTPEEEVSINCKINNMDGLTLAQAPDFVQLSIFGTSSNLLGNAIGTDDDLTNCYNISQGWLCSNEQDGEIINSHAISRSTTFSNFIEPLDYRTAIQSMDDHTRFQDVSLPSLTDSSSPDSTSSPADNPQLTESPLITTECYTRILSKNNHKITKPKRKAQNREAQRTFRDRKIKQHEDLVRNHEELRIKYSALLETQRLHQSQMSDLKQVLALIVSQL